MTTSAYVDLPLEEVIIGVSPIIGGIVGSILFVGPGPVISQDNTNFFWDDTLNIATIANIKIPTMTPGSIIFAGTGGLLSQDNSNLFFDDANNRLGLRMNVPKSVLHMGFTGGTSNNSSGVIGGTAIILGKIGATSAIGNGTIITGGTNGTHGNFGEDSAIFGYHNDSTSGFCSFIAGAANTITSGNFNSMFGANNYLNVGNYNITSGYFNTNFQGSANIVCGTNNTNYGENSFVGGGNNVPQHVSSLIVGGLNDGDGSYSIVAGLSNTMAAFNYGYLNGSSNIASGTANIISAISSTVSGYYCLAMGTAPNIDAGSVYCIAQGNTNTAVLSTSCLMIGANNQVDTSINCFAFGDSNQTATGGLGDCNNNFMVGLNNYVIDGNNGNFLIGNGHLMYNGNALNFIGGNGNSLTSATLNFIYGSTNVSNGGCQGVASFSNNGTYSGSTYCFVGGGNSNQLDSAYNSTILGDSCRINTSSAYCLAGGTQTEISSVSTYCIGYGSKLNITDSSGCIVSGDANDVSSSVGIAVFGSAHSISGATNSLISGHGAKSVGNYSVAIGSGPNLGNLGQVHYFSCGQNTSSTPLFANSVTSQVNYIESFAGTGSDKGPNRLLMFDEVSTTNATPTTIRAFSTPTNSITYGRVYLVGRRTGGSAGTANDCAAYKFNFVVKNSAGTVTLLLLTTLDTYEDQVAWDRTMSISSTSWVIQVTGATNNNIRWECSTEISQNPLT